MIIALHSLTTADIMLHRVHITPLTYIFYKHIKLFLDVCLKFLSSLQGHRLMSYDSDGCCFERQEYDGIGQRGQRLYLQCSNYFLKKGHESKYDNILTFV